MADGRRRGGFVQVPGVSLGECREIVTRADADQLWDQIQAQDVPQPLIDYVTGAIKEKVPIHEILHALGIRTNRSPAWKKILSAFNQGYRINGPILVAELLQQHLDISKKLRVMMDEAFEKGVDVLDSKGNQVTLKGPTKELTTLVETWGRNNERFFVIAQKSGMIRDPAHHKSGNSAPATIVLTNNIKLPAVEEIKKNQEEMQAKMKAIEIGDR